MSTITLACTVAALPSTSAPSQSLDADLLSAVVLSDVESVRALLQQGANVDATSKNGNTPLHQAAIKGHSQITLALINGGSRINAINEYGETLLKIALGARRPKDSRQEVAGMLREREGTE